MSIYWIIFSAEIISDSQKHAQHIKGFKFSFSRNAIVGTTLRNSKTQGAGKLVALYDWADTRHEPNLLPGPFYLQTCEQ